MHLSMILSIIRLVSDTSYIDFFAPKGAQGVSMQHIMLLCLCSSREQERKDY